MGHRQHTVPQELRDRAFTVGQAAAAGVSSSQLTRGPYTSLARGVWQAQGRAPQPDPRDELLALLPAFLSAAPGSAASHISAALLLDLYLPAGLQRPEPIHLTRRVTGRRSRSDGFAGHRAVRGPEQFWDRQGLAVTGPARTAVDLAGMHLRDRPRLSDEELVALLDGVISQHRTGLRRGAPALHPRELLERDLVLLSGVRGIRRVRRALQRTAPAVDSPLETAVRLCLIDHGLTGWVTDLVLSAPNGARVWPDLADPEHLLSIQVDGAHHDAVNQRKRDIARSRITEAAGWTELRVTVDDLRTPGWPQVGAPPQLITMVRSARELVASRSPR